MNATTDLAELRRRHAALTPFALCFLSGGPGGDPYITLAGEDGSPLSGSGFDAVLLFAEIAAADLPALLDAAAERDALTVAQPCVMRLGEVYDFAWCETHDRTFALGSSCDHAGLSHVDYLDDDGRKQRGRAVRAEMEMERIAAERDALAAKVERVRALHAVADCGDPTCEHCPCSTCPPRLGWPCPTVRALDEEPQP